MQAPVCAGIDTWPFAPFFCALEAPNERVRRLFLAGIEIRSRIGMAVVEQDF
jgi:hypothetical protein